MEASSFKSLKTVSKKKKKMSIEKEGWAEMLRASGREDQMGEANKLSAFNKRAG